MSCSPPCTSTERATGIWANVEAACVSFAPPTKGLSTSQSLRLALVPWAFATRMRLDIFLAWHSSRRRRRSSADIHDTTVARDWYGHVNKARLHDGGRGWVYKSRRFVSTRLVEHGSFPFYSSFSTLILNMASTEAVELEKVPSFVFDYGKCYSTFCWQT